MTMGQKKTHILESLKNSQERPPLKAWVIQNIEEDTSFNKTDGAALKNFLKKLEDKFQISNWNRTRELWDEILDFKREDNEESKKY